MGKLIYTNRKSEGVKLGQIVAKDLRRKNKPSSASKADPNKDTSLLELQLDGKDLTDDGLVEVARAFEEVLISKENVFHTKLQILNISGNDLTVRALAELSSSLQAAANDLEDLDLSNNRISVTTSEDGLQWEKFLMALEKCNKLRRLNFEGNNFTGSLAFEILAKVYFRQCQRNAAVRWHASDFTLKELISEGIQALRLDSSDSDSSMARGDRGLPSVGNINFANTSMTDSGALFLSYVLELRVVGPDMEDAECGIDYLPNAQLGPIGTKILKHGSNFYEESGDPASNYAERFRPEKPSIIPSSRRSFHTPYPRKKGSSHTVAVDDSPRVVSHQSLTTDEEYESLRRKVQRAIIEEKGAHNVQLWGVSLKLLSYARILVEDVKKESFKAPLDIVRTPDSSPRRNRSLSGAHLTPHTAPTPQSVHAKPHPVYATPQPTYASKLILNTNVFSSTALPLTAFLRHPITTPSPRQTQTGTRRQSSSNNTSSPSCSTKTDFNTPRSSTVASSVDISPYKADPEPLRFVGRLPEKVWVRVFAHMADPRGSLSDSQIERIVEFAKDRATLASEVEALGKPDSVQIWKVLDGMGSLAYDLAV